MAKFGETEINGVNSIVSGTEITGDIKSSGDIRIDGTLVGNLMAKGKVVVGETGKVKGEINCKSSDVLGTVEGKVMVSELLSLKSTCKVNGDLITNKLAIEPGCKFTGNCNMSGEKSLNDIIIGSAKDGDTRGATTAATASSTIPQKGK